MNLITHESSIDVMTDIHDRIYDIPFDNSQFQNENFIINSSLTRERAYRNAGLRLQDRLIALNSTKLKLRRDDIRVLKLQKQLAAEVDELEMELIAIDIEEIESSKVYTNKLINDAIVEANQLYAFMQSCPRYTREEFEAAERKHFEERLLLDANGTTGALKSLHDMGVDLKASVGSDKLIYKEDKNELLLR